MPLASSLDTDSTPEQSTRLPFGVPRNAAPSVPQHGPEHRYLVAGGWLSCAEHTNLTDIPKIHSQHPTSAMDASSFNNIPAEIRNEIFRLALTTSGPIELRRGNEPGLLQTSRQIRHETQSVFWTDNTFIIDITEGSGGRLAKLIAAIDPVKLSQIPTIVLRSRLMIATTRLPLTPMDDVEIVVDALAARDVVAKEQVKMDVVLEFQEDLPPHIRSELYVQTRFQLRKAWCEWLWLCAYSNGALKRQSRIWHASHPSISQRRE
ncbi:hypothetical protein LTR91_011251 [Friedmanniomyces endolithicus]|uniref:F-box domain-containing protein n=1 Tax=Friedmanniomyces endolithicus TaxID=329885 RepID=A0AAN6QS51_9PEZI|nr:hypothetical protein LTR91_011251 [Friedmanniomyces endolithicus]